MIPNHSSSFEEVIRMSREACDALSDEDDDLKRGVLGHAGSRWSLGVVYLLATNGTLRHAELARNLPGITQRMLTRTLRQLARDGLIDRHDYGEMPPRVEYRLTDLGRGFLTSMLPLWGWILGNAQAFRDARSRFDEPAPPVTEWPGSLIHRL